MGMAAFGRAVLRFPEGDSAESADVLPAGVGGSTTSTIRITKVEFADTATIISFHERYKPGWWIQMSKGTWLLGDDNRKYKPCGARALCWGNIM